MERGCGSREGFLEEGDEQELGEELCVEMGGADRWGISDYLLGWGRSGGRRGCSLGRRSRPTGRRPKGVDTALGGAPEGREYRRAPSASRNLPVWLFLPRSSSLPAPVGLCRSLTASPSLSLSFCLCLSVSLSPTPFLSSGHLRKMSVRDKDTRKHPGGWAGSEVRGTGTAERRDRR